MATQEICGCFGNLRTRYKRLVDKIFPSDPSQGLVNSNMEKLRFYALSAPEKLDRIGGYMYMKMNNHLYRKRTGFVYIAMEAMDDLLLACRSNSLNLFVESFLKMVSTLLECHEPGLQICATNSFVKFANIEEATPSYHRRYEFFVSRFSQMCYGNNDDLETEKKIRLSGLRGLQGVVRKTVNDDLQANIWDDVHMSKIVPALLFNIESDADELMRKSSISVSAQVDLSTDAGDQNPAVLADLCLRELVTRAGFSNIAAILSPLLTYLDSRNLWLKNDFPLHIFKIIMYSIQNQYSYRAIELLLSHLDKQQGSEARMRASIVEMISASVSIASGGSIGPSILEVFNTLLKHLQISVDLMCTTDKSPNLSSSTKDIDENSETLVQKAIINAAGAFSSILADYQAVEVIVFILGKTSIMSMAELIKKRHSLASEIDEDSEITSRDQKDELLQLNLLKCVLKVAESHHTKNFSSTMSAKLLETLLAGLVLRNTDIRLYVQKLLITLLDRKKNMETLEKLSSYSVSEQPFNIEQCSRQDSVFMKKNSQNFKYHIYESCKLSSNRPEHYKLLAYALCLLVIEFGEEHMIVELVGFVLSIQGMVKRKDLKLTDIQVACLHALVAVFFLLISNLTAIPVLRQHCEQVVGSRRMNNECLLPDVAYGSLPVKIEKHLDNLDESLLFDRNTVVNALKSSNYDTTSIDMPYEPKPGPMRSISNASLPDHLPIIKGDSQLSLGSSIYKVDASAPRITYEDLKKALRGEVTTIQPVLNFKKATFEEIVQHNERIAQEFDAVLDKSLEIAISSRQATLAQGMSKTLFEMDFPKMYVY